MKSSLVFLFLSVIQTHALAEDGACLFYQDKDRDLYCQSRDNYLVDYGFKYCERFTKLENETTSSLELKTWISKTRSCLQEMIADNEKRYVAEGCKQLKEFAFDTHPICYKQYGVCQLPIVDKSKIVKLILKNDFLSDLGKETRATLMQTINVLASCLSPRTTISEGGELFYHLIQKSKSTLSPKSLQAASDIMERSPDTIAEMQLYFAQILQVMKGKKNPEISSTQWALIFKGSQMSYDQNLKGTWRASQLPTQGLSSSDRSQLEQVFNEALTDDQMQAGLQRSLEISKNRK